MSRSLPLRAAMLVAVVIAWLPSAATARTFTPPRIRHIWVIVLENRGYEASFGDPSADPYLAQTLRAQGALLENYYATGHESADNYISLISGQPPNPQNQADCQLFDEFTGVALADGVEAGEGCVFGPEVQNIGTQLSAAGRNWKAYEQDMGNDPAREGAACGHPAVGALDNTQKAEPGDGYAARHDPFVYFRSVIGDEQYCAAHVVALGGPGGEMPASAAASETGLAFDLAHPAHTPAFSFITPNLCADGHDYPCTNEASGASAAADAERFLRTWVPKIEASRAYRSHGLIEITFDESAGPESDSSACCDEPTGPNTPAPGIAGPGGGRVGALLISPRIAPGTVLATEYDHYSSLASWEELLGLPALAEAAGAPRFAADVFAGAQRPASTVRAPARSPKRASAEG